jgi:hypothetical protein
MCLYPWVLDDAIGKEIQLKTLAPFYERVFFFFDVTRVAEDGVVCERDSRRVRST